MEIEELPSHIRKLWESAEVIHDGKRNVFTLLPFGRGGKSSEALTREGFIEQSIKQIKRNAEGYYLAWEVARLVADSLAWPEKDEQSLLLEIADAIKKRELAVQENIPGNCSLLKSWESYQSFSHYLRAESVNDWLLNKGLGFRLPDSESGHLQRPAGSPIEGRLKGAVMTMRVPKGRAPKLEPEDRFFSGIDHQEKGRNYIDKLPLDSPMFELTEVGAAHWVVMDAWTLTESALLLSGANPKRISEFDKDSHVAKPDLESCGYVGIFDRLSRASEVGVLTFPAAPSTVCEWASKKHGIPASLRVALAAQSNESTRINQTHGVTYSSPRFPRLQVLTPWRGGRITDTDVLTLDEAARMASRHAGEDVPVAEFLRAAGRGEIVLRAIVHRSAKVQRYDGGIYCNKGAENENVVPSGSIPTLPLTACQHLAAVGRASWRTFDGFVDINGTLMRFTEALLTDDEPDFETVPADCRVTGNDMHALADAFCVAPAKSQAAAPTPDGDSTSNAPAWKVVKPKRYNGYTAPLHRLLAAACTDGKQRPTARDVLEAWRNNAPAEIAKVLPDGFDYYDAKGDTKSADLEALRKAIGRMTVAREAPV